MNKTPQTMVHYSKTISTTSDKRIFAIVNNLQDTNR